MNFWVKLILVSHHTHNGAGLALTVSKQPVDVDRLTVLCGKELAEPLQSPHPVSSSCRGNRLHLNLALCFTLTFQIEVRSFKHSDNDQLGRLSHST